MLDRSSSTTAAKLLDRLRALGCVVFPKGPGKLLLGPPEQLTPELTEELAANAPAVVMALKREVGDRIAEMYARLRPLLPPAMDAAVSAITAARQSPRGPAIKAAEKAIDDACDRYFAGDVTADVNRAIAAAETAWRVALLDGAQSGRTSEFPELAM